MSCEKNTNAVSHGGAVAAGVPATASRAAFSYGALKNSVNNSTKAGLQAYYKMDETRAQGVALGAYMLGITRPRPPEGAVKRTFKGAVTGVALGTATIGLKIAAYRHPGVAVGMKLVKGFSTLTSLVGSGLAAVTKTEEAGSVMQSKQFMYFFKRQVPVALWKSSLSNRINRADIIGDPTKVLSSEGIMFRPAGRETWHRGTTVLKLPDGKRTVTHLQNLAFPAKHYYFNQPVSDQNAVGIAAGKMDPRSVPGYVGGISAVESMCPTWGESKQAIIKSHMHYGPKG